MFSANIYTSLGLLIHSANDLYDFSSIRSFSPSHNTPIKFPKYLAKQWIRLVSNANKDEQNDRDQREPALTTLFTLETKPDPLFYGVFWKIYGVLWEGLKSSIRTLCIQKLYADKRYCNPLLVPTPTFAFNLTMRAIE